MSHISPTTSSGSIPRKSLPLNYTVVEQTPHISDPRSSNEKSADGNEGDSKWVIGWKTPAAMITCYILALLIALAHLFMFLFLNDKPTSSYPQSYITTASTILASIFGLALKAALGIAFTQNLWSILRKSAQKLDTIEHLFTMRGNPFSAFRWAVVRCAPVLSVFTIVLWGLQVATTFPPGALTVIAKAHTSSVTPNVMQLNTSYIGNGTTASLIDTAIAVLDVTTSNNDGSGMITSIKQSTAGISTSKDIVLNRRGSVLRSASHTMISQSISTANSDCGANCTYSIQFVGPHLTCDAPKNSTSGVIAFGDSIPIYYASWSNPLDDKVVQLYPAAAFSKRASSQSVATLNITTYNPVGFSTTSVDPLVEVTFLLCRPAQITYNVTVTFLNGVQTFAITTLPSTVRQLTDLTTAAPGLNSSTRSTSTIWPTNTLSWLSDANNMALIEAMSIPLAGQYNVKIVNGNSKIFNYTLPSGKVEVLSPIVTSDSNYDPVTDAQADARGSSGPVNGTIIASTGLNLRVNDYSTTLAPSLHITEDSLNEMLQNITISLMNKFGIWSSNVAATKSEMRNVYSFSNRINLLLPYFLSLAISIPLLIIGFVSLWSNGVSAVDGGFLQVLVTTAESWRVAKVARRGALGGDENVTEELRELRVRYGELADERESGAGSEGVRRRVGFGVEDEVIGIRKGVQYGGGGDGRERSGESSILL